MLNIQRTDYKYKTQLLLNPTLDKNPGKKAQQHDKLPVRHENLPDIMEIPQKLNNLTDLIIVELGDIFLADGMDEKRGGKGEE